jgi:MFS transporter, ACS family, tartrate transporter
VTVPGLPVAITGFYATQGIFYAIPGSFLKGKSAAAGIALVTSMGILGGFAGPAWIGWMKDATGSYQFGPDDAGHPMPHRCSHRASVITLKPAIRYHFKTGQRDWPKT